MDSMGIDAIMDNISSCDINGSLSAADCQPKHVFYPLNTVATCLICGTGTILNSLIIVVIVYGSLMKNSVFMILLLVLAFFDLSQNHSLRAVNIDIALLASCAISDCPCPMVYFISFCT